MRFAWRVLLFLGSLWIADGCHHHGLHKKFKCGGPFLKDGHKCKNFAMFKFAFGVCCGEHCIVPPDYNPCTMGPKPPSKDPECFDKCDKPCVSKDCGAAPTPECRKRCVDKCSSECGIQIPTPRPPGPEQYKHHKI